MFSCRDAEESVFEEGSHCSQKDNKVIRTDIDVERKIKAKNSLLFNFFWAHGHGHGHDHSEKHGHSSHGIGTGAVHHSPRAAR